MKYIALASLLFASTVFAQDTLPTPVPDPAPNAELGGPLDNLFARLASRFDTTDKRIAEMDAWWREREATLLGRLGALHTELQNNRHERRIERAEMLKRLDRWTPLQNIADRLLALGWKLIGVVILFFVLIELVRAGVAWMISRIFKTALAVKE